jgi:co-chaperonin GroES (HSP10)
MNPTANRLLVRVIPEVVKKLKKGEAAPPASGVLKAEVLKLGPEVKVKSGIYVGMTVVFAPYGVDEVIVDGEKLLLVTEDLIIAIYVKEKEPNTASKR